VSTADNRRIEQAFQRRITECLSGSDASVKAVFDRRKRYWENGYRPLEIWNADEIVGDDGKPLNKPGKQPRGQWRKLAARNPPTAAKQAPDQRALNTGLLCGDIVGIDVDVLVPGLVDDIVHLVETRLGVTPLTRIGQPPKILLVYRADKPFSKLLTPDLLLDGVKVKVEILAEGQQFVADGIHPDTREPYTWTGDCSPEDVRVDELLVVTEEQARALIGEIERLLRAAGAADEKPQREARQPGNGTRNDFFAQVNAAALKNVGSWARRVFPTAKYQPQTGAWRVSSKDLGRNLEEDLSIHPDGIRDFGEEKSLTPIDIVMQYDAGIDSVRQAALRLCGYMHISPDSRGYTAPWSEPQPNKRDPDPIGLDDLDARSPAPDREKEEKPPLWNVTRPSDWAGRDVSPRIFIMEDWIPLAEYVGLYGVGGVRKTDFLIQALIASSAGLAFCGFPMMHCVTFGLFCEDTEEEIIRRVDRIAAFYGRTRADFTGFFFASLVGTTRTEFVNFDMGRMLVQDAFHEFDRMIAECGAGLAALDTVADFFGGDEINRRHVSQFMRLLNGCTMRNNCAVLGSRHPSQRGRTSGTFDSGSTGWEGKERARLVLRDPAFDQGDDADKRNRSLVRQPSNRRILTRAKSNYAQPGEEIELIFEDGGFKRLGAGTAPKGHMRDLAADAKFLELLRKTRGQGRWVHDAANNPSRFAPTVFAADADRGDFSRAEFNRAMMRLFGSGRIKLDRKGGAHGHNEIIENQ
jgi:RecA-family ATPase